MAGVQGGATLSADEERWRLYIRDSLIETAISKDILMLTRVEKPVLLRQLFVMACEYSGQILSYQKMLGQLTDAGNTTTLAHYQKLLESAFLIRGLSKWSGRVLRRRNSSPKWLALNTGLRTALANRSLRECKEDAAEWGRLTETAVGAHLVNAGLSEGIEVYYWREGNHEVDFVIRKGDRLCAVDVKTGRKRIQTSGLNEFVERYPRSRQMVVGVGGVGLKDFFETPVKEWVR